LNALVYLLVAIAVAAAIISAWYFLPRQLAKRNASSVDHPHAPGAPTETSNFSTSDLFNKEDKIRASLGTLVASISLVLGVFVTIYQLQSNERSQRDQQATTLLIESTKLLGSESSNEYSRAAAIQQMLGVMRNNRDYQKPVLGILVAFVRSRRSEHAYPGCVIEPVSDAPDVQAAIDVIGQRDSTGADQTPFLDFSALCLYGANFKASNWHDASFYNSDLRKSEFDGADVTGAIFSEAYFDYFGVTADDKVRNEAGFNELEDYERLRLVSSFKGAHAEGALFGGACLRGVSFVGSHLKNARFYGASVSLADFKGATGLNSAEQFLGSCSYYRPKNLPPSITLALCAKARPQPVGDNEHCNYLTRFPWPDSPSTSVSSSFGLRPFD
jgi:uncharacterized protein YjbI with pentapeptide repeats